MLSIIWYLLQHQPFFPFTIPSRASLSRQFLLSQWPRQFLFLLFISSSIILPSSTLPSKITFLFCLSILHASSFSVLTSVMLHCFCSFRRRVQVSAPYNATLHAKHFTSLFLISFSMGPQKMLLFLLKAYFAIAIYPLLYFLTAVRVATDIIPQIFETVHLFNGLTFNPYIYFLWLSYDNHGLRFTP